jgi:hypothetical protein
VAEIDHLRSQAIGGSMFSEGNDRQLTRMRARLTVHGE